MATAERWDYREQFEPVTDMLNSGRCEPMKAAVHGVLMATVAVCAAYNTAAWIKRRQPHLAINALIYAAAVLWEHSHVVHHLRACPELEALDAKMEGPHDTLRDAA